MTQKEIKTAIQNFKTLCNKWEDAEEMFSENLEIQIDDEFMQSIYTAISILEYRLPKKVNGRLHHSGICPNCNENLYFIDTYCPYCGQHLNWNTR